MDRNMKTLFFNSIFIALCITENVHDDLFNMVHISDAVSSCQLWAIHSVETFLQCGIFCSFSESCNTFYFLQSTSKCYTTNVVLNMMLASIDLKSIILRQIVSFPMLWGLLSFIHKLQDHVVEFTNYKICSFLF